MHMVSLKVCVVRILLTNILMNTDIPFYEDSKYNHVIVSFTFSLVHFCAIITMTFSRGFLFLIHKSLLYFHINLLCGIFLTTIILCKIIHDSKYNHAISVWTTFALNVIHYDHLVVDIYILLLWLLCHCFLLIWSNFAANYCIMTMHL